MSRTGQSRAEIERSWQDFRDGNVPSSVRSEVLGSWQRSAAVNVGISEAPLSADAPLRWKASPVARAFDAIADELSNVALDGDFVAAVTDADGTIVWSMAGPQMRKRAERVHFAPGGRWGEDAVGTNALGLALREDRAATVWSAEHYAPIVHDWVCYSAPIHDPLTKQPCGVIDLSATWQQANPLALTTVRSLALLLDHALVDLAAAATPLSPLELHTLGRSEIVIGTATRSLPPRQMELLTVLSIHPDGLTLEQLHDRLHGDRRVQTTTTKAEMSHLRQVLGDRLANRPYRLVQPFTGDHLDLMDALQAHDLDRAVQVYRGPLLPFSEAPAIVDQRHLLDVSLRRAVLGSNDVGLVARLAGAMPFDAALHEFVVDRLPATDPRRALAKTRLDALY